MTRSITHNPAQQRFEWLEDGILCVLDYRLSGKLMTIVHTGVPEAVGGQGIAADLTQAALDTASAHGWKVRPVCSYAAAYLQRHPQYQELMA